MSPMLALCVTYAAAIGLQADWNVSYAESLSAARQEGRPLIVLLEDPKRAEFRGDSLFADNWKLLEKFEVCRVDATSSYGKRVAEVYGATIWPYTVITDQECREIKFRGAGQFSQSSWRETLVAHLPTDDDSPSDFIAVVSSGDNEKDSPAPEFSASVTGSSKAEHLDAVDEIFPDGDLDEALQQAHEQDRTTLVFVSMNGCHYCDKMRDETFGDLSVISAVSEYETVMIKRERNAKWVAEQGVKLFPTTLIVAADGRVTDRIEGFVTPSKFRDLLHGDREIVMSNGRLF